MADGNGEAAFSSVSRFSFLSKGENGGFNAPYARGTVKNLLPEVHEIFSRNAKHE